MSYYGGSGAALGSSTSALYDSSGGVIGTPDTVYGIAYNADGSRAQGKPVRLKVYDLLGLNLKEILTGSSTNAQGIWSYTNASKGDGLGHMYVAEVDTIQTAIASVVFAPAFKNVRFDGTTFERIASGGLWKTADYTSPVATVVNATTITFASGAFGQDFDPGVVQTLAKVSGTGTITANVAARVDGKVYGEDIYNIVATGANASSPPVFSITRKLRRIIMSALIKTSTANASLDMICALTNGFIFQHLTSGAFRFGMSGQFYGTYASGKPLSTVEYRRVIISVDLTKATAAEAVKAYVDDTEAVLTQGTFSGAASVDFATAALAGITIGANTAATAANIQDADMSYFWMGVGAELIDAQANVFDITQKAWRDKFNASSFNLSDGSGITGNKPIIMLTGAANEWTINKGRGNNFTQTGTLTDQA